MDEALNINCEFLMDFEPIFTLQGIETQPI